MVFYLKYRPQLLSQLDLKEVRERLQRIVAAGRIPHAFLFTGPKGTGKTSAARIIAKVINCEKSSFDKAQDKAVKGPASAKTSVGKQQLKVNGQRSMVKCEPCNTCDTCVSITNGSNLDVLEIDAASNRGIDEIRSLREKIKLSPVATAYKVYIIDEVHMLTTEAFNALLKTIEEPPKHAYFILATTQPEKLPETITSRCFAVEFRKATNEEIVRALERIAKGEKITVERDVLAFIAKQADGAFRDAVKLFEEASISDTSGAGRIVTLEKAQAVTGSVQAKEEQFLTALAKHNTSEALRLIQQLVVKGANLRLFSQSILNRLHRQLLSSFSIEGETEDILFPRSELVSLMRLLSRAAVESKSAPIAQLPLELAVVEWGKQDSGIRNKELGRKGSKKRKDKQETGVVSHNSFLQQLIEAIKSYNHSIAGVLRSCQELTIDADTVIIKANYQFHYDRLNEIKVRKLLSEVASEMLGRQVQVKPNLVK